MDTALLGLRVVLSLACVLGLIWFAGRKLQGSAGVRKQRSVPLSVLGRQSLGKGAGIALVEVAGRVLLLGVGEQGVRVLTEVDVPEAPAAPERVGEVREEIDLSLVAATDRDVLVAVPDDGIDLGVLSALGGDPAGADAADVPRAHTDGAARMATLAGPAAGQGASEVGALHGSVLSPDTWRRAVDVVQRRTARR
jgi:flagellar protein FliO/FliZ